MPYVIDDIQKKNPLGDFYALRSNWQGISTTKGTETMEGLLLSQYANSPNMKEYFGAFISELDILFEQADEVYLGQMLEFAVGSQLDVIGVILDQSRNVELPSFWFGFQGAPDVAKMSDEAFPTDGGLFQDENFSGFVTTPLDDATYRKVLIAKAICNNLQTCSINDAYYIIQTLIGFIPAVFSIVEVSPRFMQLNIAAVEVNMNSTALVNYMAKYFVPNGVTFSISRV